jgi:hypothetical protein
MMNSNFTKSRLYDNNIQLVYRLSKLAKADMQVKCYVQC